MDGPDMHLPLRASISLFRRFLLGRLGGDDHQHSLTFQFRQAFDLTELGESLREFEQYQFSPLLEHDGASFELDVGLDLVTILQEVLGVPGLEIEVMIICSGRKADLLEFGRFAFGLHFLLLLLLIVEELVVVHDLTDRRIGLRRDLHQVQLQLLCDPHGFLGRINANRHIVSHQTHLGNTDILVDAVFWLLAGHELTPESAGAGFVL